MSDRSCPCDARLNRSTAVRSLGSPFFRVFMSIRTMKTLKSTTKVCNICRHLYSKWRRENPEFSSMVNIMDGDDSEIEAIDRLLAIMFDLPDKRTVSRVISSVRQTLMVSFTPFNLGFGHVTRPRIIDQHTTTISRQLMCGDGKDTAILVLDGTYIYIQKSQNNCIPAKVFQYSQETISTETNDNRISDWLYRGMCWSFPLRFLQQRRFDNQERFSRKHGQDLGMD
ncbi:unnamed protein product [Adineta ricciae]|uniref:Uncharacterized protein n=1 Tax=Adineta ricciae TaxID=249248 RepID=A0A816ETA0_ADIRI|nr:unnamed protein product [Adineta ricciae]